MKLGIFLCDSRETQRDALWRWYAGTARQWGLSGFGKHLMPPSVASMEGGYANFKGSPSQISYLKEAHGSERNGSLRLDHKVWFETFPTLVVTLVTFSFVGLGFITGGLLSLITEEIISQALKVMVPIYL